MKLFKRISDWLGISPPEQEPQMMTIRDQIDLGRHHRYAEKYSDALDIFRQVEAIAQSRQDTNALAIIRLNIADTLIQMRDYDEAHALLADLQTDFEARQHATPLAYTLCLIGYLQQLDEDWETARDTYNHALSIADTANANGAIGRAKGHLADTYLHEGNATYAEHLLRDALPLLDDSNDMELGSHFIGQYGLTLIKLGKETDGDRLLETALQRAKRLKFTTQIRHWLQVIAERKLDTGDFSSAFNYYHEFLKLSPDPLPETEAYGLILSNLSEITRQLGQQQSALDYALQAEKILSQLDDATVSSQALTAIGLAMRAKGQYDDALTYLNRALDETYDSDDTTYIKLDIAKTYTMTQRYSDAEQIYSALIDIINQDNHPEQQAQAHLGLGLAYREQNQLEKAIQQWSMSVKIYENQSDHNQVARLICDIAQAHYELGEGKRTMSEYERALMLLNSVDKDTRGIVMANAATAYADKGDVATTEAFFSEAIDIARDSNNKGMEAIRRNNYARFLIDIGQAQRAIVSLEHALKLVSKTDNPLHNALFRCNMGVAYRVLEDYYKAESYHEQAHDLLEPLDASDWTTLNHLYLVEVYLDVNEVEIASQHMPDSATDNIDVTIQYYITSARLHLMQGNLEDASTAIKKAVSQSQAGFRQRLLARSLMMKSQIEAQMEDKDTANETWHQAEKLLILLQMPVPNPNWLHVPSDT